jgi:hypothetical protein
MPIFLKNTLLSFYALQVLGLYPVTRSAALVSSPNVICFRIISLIHSQLSFLSSIGFVIALFITVLVIAVSSGGFYVVLSYLALDILRLFVFSVSLSSLILVSYSSISVLALFSFYLVKWLFTSPVAFHLACVR